MSEPGTFEVWYEANYQRLLRSMTLAAGDRHVASEVTDEAFLRAFERWHRVQVMASPVAWTFRVAVNLLRRHRRRNALERRLLLAGPRQAADVPSPELAVEVWTAVRRLPPRAREAIALRYLGGLTEAETATAMRLAPGTVARMLHDARRTLAAELGEVDEPEAPVPRADRTLGGSHG